MFRKINIALFSIFSLFFLIGLYKLFISEELFPYLISEFFVALGFFSYLSIIAIQKSLKKRELTLISSVGIFTSIALVLSYFYPDFLKLTWNFTFAFVMGIIFYSLAINFRMKSNWFERISHYSLILTEALIVSALLFKLSNSNIHNVIFFSLMISTFMSIIALGMRFVKKNQ